MSLSFNSSRKEGLHSVLKSQVRCQVIWSLHFQQTKYATRTKQIETLADDAMFK